MEQPLTLESLLSEYTLDLHIEERLKTEDRAILAQMFHIDKILFFGNQIGLAASQQSDVKTAHREFGTGEAMTKTLEFWNSINPFYATFKNLLLYLLDQREGGIAVAVCEYLLKKRANEVC